MLAGGQVDSSRFEHQMVPKMIQQQREKELIQKILVMILDKQGQTAHRNDEIEI